MREKCMALTHFFQTAFKNVAAIFQNRCVRRHVRKGFIRTCSVSNWKIHGRRPAIETNGREIDGQTIKDQQLEMNQLIELPGMLHNLTISFIGHGSVACRHLLKRGALLYAIGRLASPVDRQHQFPHLPELECPPHDLFFSTLHRNEHPVFPILD